MKQLLKSKLKKKDIELITRTTIAFIKAIEKAHKRAAKSKLIFKHEKE